MRIYYTYFVVCQATPADGTQVDDDRDPYERTIRANLVESDNCLPSPECTTPEIGLTLTKKLVPQLRVELLESRRNLKIGTYEELGCRFIPASSVPHTSGQITISTEAPEVYTESSATLTFTVYDRPIERAEEQGSGEPLWMTNQSSDSGSSREVDVLNCWIRLIGNRSSQGDLAMTVYRYSGRSPATGLFDKRKKGTASITSLSA